jgi:hypothetical protein
MACSRTFGAQDVATGRRPSSESATGQAVKPTFWGVVPGVDYIIQADTAAIILKYEKLKI